MAKILIVDDHLNTTEAIHEITTQNGWETVVKHDAESAFEVYKLQAFDLIVTDMKMPGMTGLDLMQKVREVDPDIPVIVITAFGTVDNAVNAMKLGAFDYVSKPFTVDEIEIKIEKALKMRDLSREHNRLQWENEYLRRAVSHGFSEIIGESDAMKSVFELIDKVSSSSSSILLLGESGTGKELVARAIHQHSPREDQPFIKLSCAALADGVLESELFGHEKGAFTGALKRKPGRFEISGSGTIFLDEIGEIPPTTQVKLLRVLQEKEFERVGGVETIDMNARVVAATNQDLAGMVRDKKFREDLYYRLNVVAIELPPLRDRIGDIPLLVNYFVDKFREESTKDIQGVQPAAMKCLLRYSWPGNIRELENVIERAVVLTSNIVLSVDDLPPNILDPAHQGAGLSPIFSENGNLNQRLEAFEKQLILKALTKARGNISVAASKLGLNRTTLRYKMEKYAFLGRSFE